MPRPPNGNSPCTGSEFVLEKMTTAPSPVSPRSAQGGRVMSAQAMCCSSHMSTTPTALGPALCCVVKSTDTRKRVAVRCSRRPQPSNKTARTGDGMQGTGSPTDSAGPFATCNSLQLDPTCSGRIPAANRLCCVQWWDLVQTPVSRGEKGGTANTPLRRSSTRIPTRRHI